MDDLISRAAAIDAIERLHGGCITDDVKNFTTFQVLSVPTVDAVQVVRCKDCKFWEEQTINDKPGGFGICSNIGGCWDGNEFCSDGERRDA